MRLCSYLCTSEKLRMQLHLLIHTYTIVIIVATYHVGNISYLAISAKLYGCIIHRLLEMTRNQPL